MSRDEMLTYIKQLNGKAFGPNEENEAATVVKKCEQLLEKFGFKYRGSFNALYGGYSRSDSKDTSWFWKLMTGEYDYIDVQVGYIPKDRTTGKGRYKKTVKAGYEGICRVIPYSPEINPATGKPYQIGETKYSDGYSVTLTRRGWYSGD